MEHQDIVTYVNRFAARTDVRAKWKHIVIHHSLTPDGITADWDAIRKYHVEVNGWRDIGYHFGLEEVDKRLSYMIGRPLNMDGGHTLGMNEKAIGICVVGNFDVAAPSDCHYWLLASLCRELRKAFPIPIYHINPHWAYADKSCPGRLFDMLALRDYIMNGGPQAPALCTGAHT